MALSDQRLFLDGVWDFWIDPQKNIKQDKLPEEERLNINVPAPWQSQSEALRNYSGPGWYRRTFNLPEESQPGSLVLLTFGAVDYLAEVWVNGEPVGNHEGGYLPFTLDITSAAQRGVNTVVVRVEDPPKLFAEIPHGKQSWYGQLSGLWQTVWVEQRPESYIQNVRITPLGDQVQSQAELSQPLAPGEGLRFEIFSPQGEPVTRLEGSEPEATLQVANPLRWDTHAPNLYTLRVTRTGPQPDEWQGSFGFRTIEARGGQLLLNGRPLYLRGALDQDYYPHLISTPPSIEFLEDQFRKAKAMGLNCLRTHIKIADPRYYEAADRAGLLIWTELPNWSILTPLAKKLARETLAGMVARDWNHPSIIIWTVVNESWGVDLTNEEHCAWVAETFDEIKRMDPNRLVVGNSACYANFHVVTDIEDFHNYYSMPDHFRKWRAWVKGFAGRPSWSFAHVYENNRLWRSFLKMPWKPKPTRPSPSVRRRGDEPLVVSEFGNWGLPDVELLRQCYGGRDPWWFETGYDWNEGIVYPHGVDGRFRDFHMDRAFPTLSALALASQRLQHQALKYEIEQLRLQPSIQGYIITEFTDVHWESNGLLDMCRNPKVYYEQIGEVNAPDLIIPAWRRLAYWEGEVCRVSLSVSHYSERDLEGSRLEWWLDGSDLSGRVADFSLPQARVVSLGTLRFRAPASGKPVRARLNLRLVTKDGETAVRNYLDLYFFPHLEMEHRSRRVYAPGLAGLIGALGYPAVERLGEARIAIVDTMTDEVRAFMQEGGQVLWLAEGERTLQTYLGTLKVKPRKNTVWQGDWANNLNWLNQDRIFRDLPIESGLVDFAFADLTPNMVIEGIGAREFETDVHAGLTVGWLHRTVALVAERHFGRGRLVVSTFQLKKNAIRHPVAAFMLRDLIGLVEGDEE